MQIMVTSRQTVWDETVKIMTATNRQHYDDSSATLTDFNGVDHLHSISLCNSYHDIRRSLNKSSDNEYLVCSARGAIIWDTHLLKRVAAEIADFERTGAPWLCLAADGVDVDGRHLAACFFDREPTITPDRGRHAITQTAGTLYVFNCASLHRVCASILPNIDFVDLVNHLIIIGYACGIGSFFSSNLFPCLAEDRQLAVRPIIDLLAGVDATTYPCITDLPLPAPGTVLSPEHFHEMVATYRDSLKVKQRFSFVIRTLYKRPYMLRRCLISIDYLRRSLGFSAEIILASDVAGSIAELTLASLAQEFPALAFTSADGLTEKGHSRVRNLVAGLKAATGTRVCIIDDDDYYSPAAIEPFSQAGVFGSDPLIIFDTQIINERWSQLGVKAHKEILSYGIVYAAINWIHTLRGSNSIPLCGIIYPGWFIRQVVMEYRYDQDLSEDFIFHLLVFAHPKRPSIRLVSQVCAYQSHRIADDNVTNMNDRTAWVLDVGNGVYDLLFRQGHNFEAISGGEAYANASELQADVAALRNELEEARHARDSALRVLATAVAKVRI